MLSRLPLYRRGAGGGQLYSGTTLTGSKNYINGIEYNGANLEAIYHADGRLLPNGAAWHYDYTIKDHLGNARVNFRANGSTWANVEEVHYYPFGMQMENAGTTNPANKYLYNGKERNEDFGLNWLDYGKRWYDVSIARFPSVDPIVEQLPYLTPYNYASNDPVGKIDLYGLQGTPHYLSTNPMDYITKPIGYAITKAAQWIDNAISFESEVGVKVDVHSQGTATVSNTTSVSVSQTTETSTNFSGPISASASCNCPVPFKDLTRSTTKINKAVENNTEVDLKAVKGESKVTVNSSSETKAEGSGEIKYRGVNLKGSVSNSTSGAAEIGVEASVGSDKAKAGVGITQSKERSGSSVKASAGYETKSGNVTTSQKVSIKVKTDKNGQ